MVVSVAGHSLYPVVTAHESSPKRRGRRLKCPSLLKFHGVRSVNWSGSSSDSVACCSSQGTESFRGDLVGTLLKDHVNVSNHEQRFLGRVLVVPKDDQLSSHKYSKSNASNFERKYHYIEVQDESVLSKRILILSRSNRVTSAIELYRSMEYAGLRLDAHAYNSLIACLVRNGSFDRALGVFEAMKRRETATGHTFSLMIKAVSSAQGCNSAISFFEALERDGMSKYFDVYSYNTILSVCARVKDWLRTERIWRELGRNSVAGTPVTYRLLVSIFVQCEQTELALEAYHEMTLNGIEPSNDDMRAIVAACTREGNWPFSLEVFQKMLACGFKPSRIVYNSLINCLGKAGKCDLAFRTFGVMRSSWLAPDAYTWFALLRALYMAGRYADVQSLFHGIRRDHNTHLDAYIYNVVLMSCHKLGLWERALRLLWQMETSGMAVSSESYNHAIFACEVASKPEAAMQVYRHMILRKCSPDTFTHQALLRACVQGSLWEEVEEILKSVAPNPSLYNTAIQEVCSGGNIALANELYEQMCTLELKPDGKTRALMRQNLSGCVDGGVLCA